MDDMTATNRADLYAEVTRLSGEVTRLTEENAELHSLVKMVRAALDMPVAVTEDNEKELGERMRRMSYMHGVLGSSAVPRVMTAIIAKILSVPLSYRPYSDAKPVPAGEQNLPAPCPAEPPDAAPGQCARLDGHRLPHRTLGGFEWGTPEHCGERPYPAGSEGDDGTECMLPAGHAGPHDDDAGRADGGQM